MPGKIILSTAYLPSIEYFARISKADEVLIEAEENYLKQSYRNRCYILAAGGPQIMSVPVLMGSFHKILIRDIRIDYSKRWQQIHLRALTSSYSSSPYFMYYFEIIERIIRKNHNFLLDLNTELLTALLKMLKKEIKLIFTTEFFLDEGKEGDFRYSIHPKKNPAYDSKEYFQVFSYIHGFVPRLSIVDLVFNMGPDSARYL